MLARGGINREHTKKRDFDEQPSRLNDNNLQNKKGKMPYILMVKKR